MYLVSIIIPTYGRPENLIRAVTSCLSQSYQNCEIIVVDDNGIGTPYQYETEKLLQDILLVDERVRYYPHRKNLNGAVARNTGVRLSTGKYIFFLDDDDEFESNKVEEFLLFFERLDVKFLYSKSTKKYKGKVKSKTEYNKSGDISLDVMCSFCDLNTSSVAISKELFDLVGGFNESFSRNQDYEFILRCLKLEPISAIDRYLTIRHVDDKSNSQNYDSYLDTRINFLDCFSHQINSLRLTDRITFYSANNLELAYLAMLDNKFLYAFKHFIKVFPTPKILSIIYFKFKRKL